MIFRKKDGDSGDNGYPVETIDEFSTQAAIRGWEQWGHLAFLDLVAKPSLGWYPKKSDGLQSLAQSSYRPDGFGL